jgi:hypothetical protein
MTWTSEQQADLQRQADTVKRRFLDAKAAWITAIQDAGREPGLAARVDPTKAQVDMALQSWRDLVNRARSSAEQATSNGTMLDEISKMAAQVAEEKETLRTLRAKQGTRDEQAHSINPKIVPSPYVNILGLQRTFRSSTWKAILIASIVFGFLALCTLSYLIYQMITTPWEPSPQLGGARKGIT